MNLNKLYKLQEELDNHILEKHNIKMSKEELLDNTILALLVEVGELANTTRCFKHWSTKGMMDKEVVLDELADCWHFYLSIGNQIKDNLEYPNIGFADIGTRTNQVNAFTTIYIYLIRLQEVPFDSLVRTDSYRNLGYWFMVLASLLGFTDEEVEQAYLKKHEENYRRQEEGY